MEWFRRRKTPTELVEVLREDLSELTAEGSEFVADERPEEGNGRESPPADAPAGLRVMRRMAQVKFTLMGEADVKPSEREVQELSAALMATVSSDEAGNVAAIKEPAPIIRLVLALDLLPFESRKHVQQVFSFLIRRDAVTLPSLLAACRSAVDSTGRQLDVMHKLVQLSGSPAPGLALNSGLMLREALRSEQLVAVVFATPDRYIWPFFENIPGGQTGGLLDALKFDLSSDAFATLRDMLTRHKPLAKEFLEARYRDLFGDTDDAPVEASERGGPQITNERRYRLYDALLNSTNYVTRRQSLKLLGELLLDRNHFGVMMKYISVKRNLKQMMILLRDESKSIQFEAFHVFKVFVANPRKPDTIVRTLVRNQKLLVQYLEHFHEDKQETQFLEEKALIIDTIKSLRPLPGMDLNVATTTASPVPPAAAAEEAEAGPAQRGDGRRVDGGEDGGSLAAAGMSPQPTQPPPPGSAS